MSRREAVVLLAVLSTGVFLAGLELMITAVALPSIVADLASWRELRLASWIVNGYLLVYVVTMPLAGRLTDIWGARRLFLGALAVFVAGSVASGSAQTLGWLIAGRCVQAVGGGALVPVATAAASHLFAGRDRPRALGVVGALTFLGMAAGPFVGAAILDSVRVEPALAARGVVDGPLVAFVAPAWRWVFYVNVPIGVVVLAVGWAASAGWETPRRPVRVDVLGGALVSLALAAGLVGITLLDDSVVRRIADLGYPPVPLLLVAGVAAILAVAHGLRAPDPFLDPRLFRDRVFSAAAVVSLLTGYAFATAILGGAIFVDRVLYGGPDSQRLVLGALAAATAAGALTSGFVARRVPLAAVTVAGLIGSGAALLWASGLTPVAAVATLAALLAVFGLGFGLTVTPRSTAAVGAVEPSAYGMASATVTVARMIGMAVGLAVLTAYGSTTIERLSAEVYASPASYLRYIPAELRDRPLKDPLVVDALERWAAGQAATVMTSVFVVAGFVTLAAIPPGLALRARARILSSGPGRGPDEGDVRGTDGRTDDEDGTEPALAL